MLARLANRIAVVVALLVARGASADDKLLSDDTWKYHSTGELAIDGGVLVGFPAALPTGLSTGVGAGFTYGGALAFGGRLSWSTATESSETWKVTHDDFKLRATAALRHTAGRGTFGLRLGLGGTLVHESRLRNQGMRAGLMGDELESSAFALLPTVDIEAVIALHIAGPWLFAASGGPTLTLDDGLHGGWTSLVGIAWQP